MQDVLSLHSWSSAALTGLLPRALHPLSAAQWIPTGFAYGSTHHCDLAIPQRTSRIFKTIILLVHLQQRSKLMCRELCTAHPCLTRATFKIKQGQNHYHINENGFHKQQKEGMKRCCANCRTKWSHRVIYKYFR